MNLYYNCTSELRILCSRQKKYENLVVWLAGRGGGVQETAIRLFGQWKLSIHNICSVASEPERAAEARSAVVASGNKNHLK